MDNRQNKNLASIKASDLYFVNLEKEIIKFQKKISALFLKNCSIEKTIRRAPSKITKDLFYL